MTFRWFLLVMALTTIGAWTGWVFLLHTIDPIHAGPIGFVLFYVTLFVSVLGTTVLLGTIIRFWIRPKELPYRQTAKAFRQGILLSGLFLSVLFLISFELLHWWSGLLVIILFSLLELLLMSRNSRIS